MRKLRKPSFYMVLAFTLALALLLPGLGAYIKGHDWIITLLIMAMYFGIGISMDISKVIAGIAKWREMLFAQVFLFVISPAIAAVLYAAFLPHSTKEAMIGLMFVSSLATPISSGIMLTESKHGNSVLSMYNVILSQFLGIFVTPLILSVFLKTPRNCESMTLYIDNSHRSSLSLPSRCCCRSLPGSSASASAIS